MVAVDTKPALADDVRAAFARVAAALPGEALRARRKAALERFASLGLPTTKDPDWRKTDLRPLARLSLRAPEGAPATELPTFARAHSFRDAGVPEVVLVDGRFAPALSHLEGVPKGVRVRALAEALDDPDVVERLGSLARADTKPLAALNEALFRDGVLVEAAPGADAPDPIHVLHVHTGAATLVSPRTLVVAGASSRVHVVETFTGPEDVAYLTNAVTEVFAADNATVDHTKDQREGAKAWHVGAFQSAQGRDATVRQFVVSVGGSVVRNEIHGRFDGEGGNLELDGLFLEHGEQHMDNHTRIDHAQPHCASREVYKGILDGRSRGVFDGMIIVRPGAQKTNAKQTNKNLLLSDEALVDSNPQLEIHADDVKCTHGSTTGQLDEDAVFYLRSRGIGDAAARSLLTYAFATDVTARIAFRPLKARVDEIVLQRLPEGEAVRGALV